MRQIKRNTQKKAIKAKKEELKKMKAENKIRANRIGFASFYRQYNSLDEDYEYVMKAKRLDEPFEAHIPCVGERDKYKELVMIFTIMCRDWKWQQPDCLAYFALIQNQLAETGNVEHYENFMAMDFSEEADESTEVPQTFTDGCITNQSGADAAGLSSEQVM